MCRKRCERYGTTPHQNLKQTERGKVVNCVVCQTFQRHSFALVLTSDPPFRSSSWIGVFPSSYKPGKGTIISSHGKKWTHDEANENTDGKTGGLADRVTKWPARQRRMGRISGLITIPSSPFEVAPFGLLAFFPKEGKKYRCKHICGYATCAARR